LQEGGLSYLARKEIGFIVQRIHKIVHINFSSFIENWEFDASTSSSIISLSCLTIIQLIIFQSEDPMKVASNSLIFIV